MGAAVRTSGRCVESAQALAGCLADAILNPLLALIFAAALLVFIFGVVEFMVSLSSDTGERKEDGKKHMLWGIIGMFIMVGAYSILTIVANTLGPEATQFLPK